jgi:hypothetical protein
MQMILSQLMTSQIVVLVLSSYCLMSYMHSSRCHGEDGITDVYIQKILEGHKNICEIRKNSLISLRYMKRSKRSPAVLATKIWNIDEKFKTHQLEIPGTASPDIMIDEKQLDKDPDAVRVATSEYEFSFHKKPTTVNGQRQLGPLILSATTIETQQLNYWQERMQEMLAQHVWGATTFCGKNSQKFFNEPSTSYISFDWRMLSFECKTLQIDKLPTGVLRMNFSVHAEMLNGRKEKQILDDVLASVDFDPMNSYRVISSDMISTWRWVPQKGHLGDRWCRFRVENEYSDSFGQGIIPKRVLAQEWQATSQNGLNTTPFAIYEYLIDKVEFGTVTPADFRGEPYGVPASLIEQDHLPPPAAWWWPWLCGLLGVNALLGLVWWFKRQRESMA